MHRPEKGISLKTEPSKAALSAADRWILSRLQNTTLKITECIDKSRFQEATNVIYEFFWHEFCDWYLEIVKANIDEKEVQWVLHRVLETLMRLLHPFMPFITEEIWQSLPHEGESLMLADWPKAQKKWLDPKIEGEIQLVISEIQSIRNVRSAWQINPKDQVQVVVKVNGDKELKMLNDHSTLIAQMAKLSSLKIGQNLVRPKESAVANIGRVETYVILSGLVDIAVERQRISNALSDVERMIKGLEGRLANKEFLNKAPKDIVEKEKQKATELEDRKKRLMENLKTLE
jgi:valyl-tRNA synthetase